MSTSDVPVRNKLFSPGVNRILCRGEFVCLGLICEIIPAPIAFLNFVSDFQNFHAETAEIQASF